jgi:hypothetical protein
LDDAKTLLQKDRARGMAVELKNWDKKFNQLGGGGQAYVDAFARKMLVSLRNDRDTKDCAYMVNHGAWQSSATPTTHINQDGGALTFSDVMTAIARMADQPGVSVESMALMCSSFGVANFRSLPNFIESKSGDTGQLGGPGLTRIGSIEGVPIFRGQGIQKTLSVATSAVVIASNVATATVPADHGLVVGMPITTTGLTTDVASATPILSASATTVTFALTAGDGALADGVGSIVAAATNHNALVNIERLWQASDPIESRMVPTSAQKTSDTFQLWEDYGRKVRTDPSTSEADPGSVIVIHTARDVISVA